MIGPFKSEKEELVAWLTIALTIADVLQSGLDNPTARLAKAVKQAELLVNEVNAIGAKRK